MAKRKASVVIPAESSSASASQTSSQQTVHQHDHAMHGAQVSPAAQTPQPAPSATAWSPAPSAAPTSSDHSRKEEYKNYAIVALATALIVVGLMWFLNGSGDTPTGAPTAGDDFPEVPSGPPQRVNLEVGDSPSMGNADAPVTIIEFSDYQCPFCGRFYSQTLPSIKRDYIDTGKVRFAYKDFPLESIHPEATPAANAARCAGEQGKYWEFHDKTFENQDLLSTASYNQWAQEIGLNTAPFAECVKSNKYASAVRDDLRTGSAAGVQGTPAFLINGLLVSGAQPYTVFQQVIDAELGTA